jgi:hypothetical protein
VHQAKYTKDIVRKFKMEDSKTMTTPMSTTTTLDADDTTRNLYINDDYLVTVIFFVTENALSMTNFLASSLLKCDAAKA